MWKFIDGAKDQSVSQHAAHQAISQYCHEVRSARTVVDYDI